MLCREERRILTMPKLLHRFYLFVELRNPCKGGTACDGIHQEEPFAISDPLISKCSVFYLSGGVQDINQTRLSINGNLLPERVFEGGITSVDRVTETKLGDGSAYKLWIMVNLTRDIPESSRR